MHAGYFPGSFFTGYSVQWNLVDDPESSEIFLNGYYALFVWNDFHRSIKINEIDTSMYVAAVKLMYLDFAPMMF